MGGKGAIGAGFTYPGAVGAVVVILFGTINMSIVDSEKGSLLFSKDFGTIRS